MKRQQPDWLNKTLYPFESRWITMDGNAIHYIDEGSGEILFFVHGTPEWSFGYRDLIRELRNSYRCIAIDLLGFGLSDKPADADYTCQAHALRL
jgi:pimeloyl-ACP methyl ester carboxylesterase